MQLGRSGSTGGASSSVTVVGGQQDDIRGGESFFVDGGVADECSMIVMMIGTISACLPVFTASGFRPSVSRRIAAYMHT